MPHVIVEYTPDALTAEQLSPMLDGVHGAVLDSGLFERDHVKTRAVALAGYRTGDADRPFVHAQLRIKPGRDRAQKRRLSQAVLAALRTAAPAARIVTVEVADLDAASYAKLER